MKNITLGLFGVLCLSLGSVAGANQTCLTRADGETFCKGERVEVQKQIAVIDEVAIDQDDHAQVARVLFTNEVGATTGAYVPYLTQVSHLLETAGQCKSGVCVGSKALHLYNQAPRLQFGQVQIISKSGIAFVTPVDHDCCTPQKLVAWNFANIAGEITSGPIFSGDVVELMLNNVINPHSGLQGAVLGVFRQDIPGATAFAFVRTGSDLTSSCSGSFVAREDELRFITHINL